MSFNIQRVNREMFQVVSVSGHMGNEECGKLEIELEHLLQEGHKRVIIDFVALTFVTTTNLLRISKQKRRFQREAGQLKIAGLLPFAIRLVKTARLESALKSVVDLNTAINSLSSASLNHSNKQRSRPAADFLAQSTKTKTLQSTHVKNTENERGPFSRNHEVK